LGEAMGDKYEITIWGRWRVDEGYSDKQVWRGSSIIKALYELWGFYRAGFGCVSLHCRPPFKGD